jgi:hypothetical protein
MVDVRRPLATAGTDELGNPVTLWSDPEGVGNVLVAVGSTSDTGGENRPDGVRVAYTLVFPKAYAASLRGCQVRVPDDPVWYAVDGDPKPQLDGQALLPYNGRNRVVLAVSEDG